MTELQLYNWINENDITFRWQPNDDGHMDVIVWATFHELEALSGMLTNPFFDEGRFNVNVQQKCVAFYMSPIVDYYDISLQSIFGTPKP